MGLTRVKRSTYECDDLLFHNHGGAPLHSQGRPRRAAKVIRWTALALRQSHDSGRVHRFQVKSTNHARNVKG
jgi:hypothetical protein